MKLPRWARDKDLPGELSGAGFAVLMVAAIAALAALVMGIGFPADNHAQHVACLRLGEQTGLPTRYARSGVDGECYIKVGSLWVPEDRWRTLTDTP